jgi:ferric hydroxamate transport system permease protein
MVKAAWAGLVLLACALTTLRVSGYSPDGVAVPALREVILWNATLPRIAMALVAGAALGLSGLILQRVLRNPLAEPSTLGISAGAQLALAAATIHAPGLVAASREGVALAGGLAAVALLLGLTWRRGLEPVAVALAGMMLGLTAAAMSAALILAHGEYVFSLFLWGGGSLVQQSWGPTLTVALRLALGAAAAAVLFRPLGLFALGDAARSLGLAVGAMRCAALGVAVWLAASVTAEVGVIGFVGLAAPALAHLSGARTLRARMLAAPAIGALLLWLTDGMIQVFGGERIPAGAATALLGGPVLLWLLPRLRLFEWPSVAAQATVPRRTRAWPMLLGLAALAGLAVLLALCLGRGADGWSFATGELFDRLLPWRGPRVAVAAAAGAMLGVAGAVLQRVTANPLAGPEILGVGSGAGVGMAAAVYGLAAPGLGVQLAASTIGAVGALVLVLGFARKGGLGPERLLLGGIAVGAFGSAILTAAIATGTRQSFDLLRWLSGATNDATPGQAGFACVAAALTLLALPLAARALRILPLGDATGRSVGFATGLWRAALVAFAGILTALAALFVGPLSFVGLIAPHLARMLGLAAPLEQAFGAALLGGGLMVASDWLARSVAFPYQLPLGLFAALLGGTYLVWRLSRGAR